MAAAQTSNNRASLLSGLRTGGVRSATNPMAIPHTAAPGGSFQVPRFASGSHNASHFPDEAEEELPDLAQQYMNPAANRYQPPKTAAIDGTFRHQQAPNPSLPFTPASYGNANMAQMQMQMMQMEIMRLQAIQAQQYQAELIAQAQRQQNQGGRRPSFNPPATAGPMTTSFDLRSTQSQKVPQLGVGFEDQVPMTAALHGRFGARLPSGQNGRTSPEENDYVPPPTPGRVISGGTSLGNSGSTNTTIINPAPSKADGATSWRRNGNNNSVLSGNRQPSVKVTPPPTERISPPPGLQAAPLKTKPQPLNFNTNSQPVPVVAVTDDSAEDECSTGSSRSAESSPITPQSDNSSEPPLSPREEASKKLYKGLGMGRPVSPGVAVIAAPAPQPQAVVHRVTSMPVRQPIGPPSGELGAKNFATRARKQAVNGLGALLLARERREVIEAC